MHIVSSAPGKLVLLGEYAVLEGAPAVVMAVNRRAEVTLTEGPDSGFVIDAVSLGIREAHCQVENGRVQWSGVAAAEIDKLKLVGAIIAASASEAALPPFRAVLNTDSFFFEGGANKLGLGSSAALTVALVGAIGALRHEPVPQARALVDMHREMQDGRGSGLDIATSLHGGVIDYRLENGHPQINAIRLPAGVEVRCVWSGQSASTGAFLARVAAWQQRAPAEYASLMTRLSDCAHDGLHAAKNDDATAWMEAAQRYMDALAALGRASDISILTPEHVKIGEVATRCGIVYKTCGAGGGDIGIAFATEPDRLSRFDSEVAKAGFQTLDLVRDDDGLRIQQSVP